MRKLISAFVIAAVCAVGSAAIAQTTTAKQDATKSGQATKTAPKATGAAAKGAGKATAAATLTATCKDGTTYTGKTKKGACSKHGGVKSWDKA